VLIVSLGFDGLGSDPEAFGRAAFALRPEDYGAIARVLCEVGLPLAVVQEGGYDLAQIPEAAAHFWAAATACIGAG